MGEITGGQQEEQQGQRAENHLIGAGLLEGAHEHKQGEDAPQQQVPGQRSGVGSLDAGEGIPPDEDEGPPEAAVSGESGSAEGVVVLELHDAGDDLCQTAQSKAHGDDDGRQRQQAAVVQVQQNGGHAEAQQTQRCGIGFFVQIGHCVRSSKMLFFVKKGDGAQYAEYSTNTRGLST